MKIIAHIRTDFPTKFGVPRQSGLVKELTGKIILEPEFRDPEAVRGLEEFSHIWLLWQFSEAKTEHFSATVRPPRLGGNTRVGVFATRSPFRPNNIGLSSVKLDHIEFDKNLGPILHVSGIDLMDNTPIYDIKPYIPYVDSHPEAKEGFTSITKGYALEVILPEAVNCPFEGKQKDAMLGMLTQDPRPSYKNDKDREYGVEFAGYDIHFKVKDNILTVKDIVKMS